MLLFVGFGSRANPLFAMRMVLRGTNLMNVRIVVSVVDVVSVVIWPELVVILGLPIPLSQLVVQKLLLPPG